MLTHLHVSCVSTGCARKPVRPTRMERTARHIGDSLTTTMCEQQTDPTHSRTDTRVPPHSSHVPRAAANSAAVSETSTREASLLLQAGTVASTDACGSPLFCCCQLLRGACAGRGDRRRERTVHGRSVGTRRDLHAHEADPLLFAVALPFVCAHSCFLLRLCVAPGPVSPLQPAALSSPPAAPMCNRC